MIDDEIEKFEELLRNKSIADAYEHIKFTHNRLFDCNQLNHKQIRKILLENFRDIANEFKFKFNLEFTHGDISYIKWYHENKWIRPINGGIIPIFPNKNRKPKRNPIPPALRHEVFVRDNYRCVECGATNKEAMLEADHIIPVSQGGSDELTNLQTLCIICNRAKSNRTWKGPQ